VINRSDRELQNPVDMLDPEAINLILDVAQYELLRLAANENLREIKLVRWRWDQPDVILSWRPWMESSFGKNIRALVRDQSLQYYRITIEGNIWHDQELISGAVLRNWSHFADESMEIEDPTKISDLERTWLRARIEGAYEWIDHSKGFAFSNAVMIFPDGTRQVVQPSYRIGAMVEPSSE
jgi:hypothetical protein